MSDLLMDCVTAPHRVPRKPGESGFAARVRNELAAETKRKRKKKKQALTGRGTTR